MLRGDPGTPVAVTYPRPGVTEPIKLRFTRRVVHIPAVAFTGMFGDHVGYIPLQTFNENAAEEVRAAVDKLVSEGAKGLVLDMRDNGGGIVEQALQTSSLFLREGQDIVSVRTRSGAPETMKADRAPPWAVAAARRPRRRRLRVGHRDRRRRAAGPRPRARARHDVVRQRARAVGLSATGRLPAQADDGEVVHAERPLDPSRPQAAPERRVRRSQSRFAEGRQRASEVQVRRRPHRSSAAGAFARTSSSPTTRCRRSSAISCARRRPQAQAINTVLQDYALELKGTVSPGFAVPQTWTTTLWGRLEGGASQDRAEIRQRGESVPHARPLESRHADDVRRSGREEPHGLAEDHQLMRAIELLEHSTTQAQLLATVTTAKR